jgi:hypothetical protein
VNRLRRCEDDRGRLDDHGRGEARRGGDRRERVIVGRIVQIGRNGRVRLAAGVTDGWAMIAEATGSGVVEAEGEVAAGCEVDATAAGDDERLAVLALGLGVEVLRADLPFLSSVALNDALGETERAASWSWARTWPSRCCFG